MVTHYTGEGGKIACGRNNHDLVSSSGVGGVRCEKCLGSQAYQQGVWFGEFHLQTSTEPLGLEKWVAGTMFFAEAAQYSLTCYPQKAQEMVDHLERQLNTLIQ